MNIISGKLKGKNIPFRNDKFDNANATPQKVKKALFSILGEDLTGKKFLDLYSCSGQIGLEAISRGAKLVVFNEIDHDRYLFIKAVIGKWDIESSALVLNYHAYRCLRFLESRKFKFDCIFIDAPYLKIKKQKQYHEILAELEKYDVVNKNGMIIIQHPSKIYLQSITETGLDYVSTKKYAKNSLSVFKHSIV